MPRVKCSILDRNKEKVYSRIATRGVVKFFNVVNQEQKEIESKLINEAGSSERKRDKILSTLDKGSFLDKLKEANPLDEDELTTKKALVQTDEPTWSVLRDNFIMGSSQVKDWDKQVQEANSEDSNKEDNDNQIKHKAPKIQNKNKRNHKKFNKRIK